MTFVEKRAATGFLSIALLTVIFGATDLRADDKKYSLADLHVLANQKSWGELFRHIQDVPPSQRTAEWNQIMADACTEYPTHDNDSSEWCYTELNSLTVAEPQNTDLAWKAGKWARRHRADWAAIPFFAKAVTKTDEARCKDEDLAPAVISGLGMPPSSSTNIVQPSKTLAFDICWTALRPVLLKKMADAGGYFKENACAGLKNKNALSADDLKKCK